MNELLIKELTALSDSFTEKADKYMDLAMKREGEYYKGKSSGFALAAIEINERLEELKQPVNQPAFLPLPEYDELTKEVEKESLVMPKGLPFFGTTPLTAEIMKFYYSESQAQKWKESKNEDIRIGYINKQVFTHCSPYDPAFLPTTMPIDSIYVGMGTLENVKFKGKWSDLPETV